MERTNSQKEILIWTEGYSPMIMGGDVNAPIGCWVKRPHFSVKLGRGFLGYVIVSPDKLTTVIVEKTSGAIIGRSLAEVQKDVSEGTTKVMKEQVVQALERVKKVRVDSAEKFWNLYVRSNGNDKV